MYSELKYRLDDQRVTLVAVSKTKPVATLLALYAKGQRIFGENRVQELVEKHEILPKDIEWHMIGALQKNKVKYIAPFIHCIHSVDGLSLAQKIDKEAAKHDRIIPILLQVKIGSEATKSGYAYDALKEDISELLMLANVQICGVMGIGTYTHDRDLTRKEFSFLKSSFDELKSSYFQEAAHFKEVSMGMSSDYLLAIQEGSTMVRIGSLLFGSR